MIGWWVKWLLNKSNDFLFYNFKMDTVTKSIIWNIKNLKGLTFKNFLPYEYVFLENNAEYLTRGIISNTVFNFLHENYKFCDESAKIYNENIFKFLKNTKYNIFLTDEKIMEMMNDVFIPNDTPGNIESYMVYARKCISIFEKEKIPYNISKALIKSFEEHNKSLKNNHDLNFKYTHSQGAIDIEGKLKNCIDVIRNYFQGIQYIGPLREEPHLQYTSKMTNIENIGIRGENCAAVLYHKSKGEPIRYISSENFNINNKITNCNINNAVNNWLHYIGVAESVYASFNGRYGYELKVKPLENEKNSDLTNVGTGISQILPIILSCLLAPERSMIIIEQPEVHLHPAVQSKLTDFFIAMIKCNKQIIIETHSEYIINQLRLRFIKSITKETLKDKVNIYFTENLDNNYNEYKKGNTLFRPLEINEYAAMSDWPDGFFDESSKIADEIIEEVSRKLTQNAEDDNE